MPGEGWATIRLGTVSTKIGSGATPRGGSDVYLESGPYALIRSQNVHNDGFHYDGLAFIGEEHAAELSNVQVQEDDVLLNITGDSVARCCQVNKSVLPARVNQHVAIIRTDPHHLDPQFLRYVLVSPKMQAQLLSWAGAGGTRNALTKNMIESLEVQAPQSVIEQCAIAHILSSLDNKIELNRRMNETLESIARAIFNSWFSDSNATRTNAAELIQTGVLEIGDGYRAKNSELGQSGLPFIRASNLKNGFDTDGADLLLDKSVAKAGSKVARVGDVAFTSKGTIGRIARVGEHTGEFVYSPQVCYWRSLARESLHPAILYCWIQTPDFKLQIEALAGQTDMAPYVSLQDQRKMNIPLFPNSQLIVGQQIEPILTRRSLNAAESRTLATLRETLLPKLVSGDLPIKDAARIIGRRI